MRHSKLEVCDVYIKMPRRRGCGCQERGLGWREILSQLTLRRLYSQATEAWGEKHDNESPRISSFSLSPPTPRESQPLPNAFQGILGNFGVCEGRKGLT